MRYLIFTLLMLCCALPALAEEERARPHAVLVSPNLSEKTYSICKTDDECVVVTPPCAAPMAFNKKSQLFLQGYFNRLAGNVTCADWVKVAQAKKTACVEERCTIELTEPKTPPPKTAFEKEPQYCEKDSDCETVIGDCCEASFLNKTHALKMRADMVFAKDAPKTCFQYDRRKVLNLRCENKKCTADLEVPLELDYLPHELKDCARWK
jgi:hypothetical protein